MAKLSPKPQANSNTPQNSPHPTPKLDNELSKSRQEINRENYQKNKAKRNAQAKVRYQQQKELATKEEKEQLSKYYGTEAIKVLMSFQDYTELNKEKQQLWLDFNWTFQDCQRSFKEGYADVVAIMKLEQVAHKLVRDFWDTAKSEQQQRSKSWNSLGYDEQQRLIRYWGYEKAKVESNYISEKERLEKQSQAYLKEIELTKHHEERGKVKCPCYSCEEKATIQKEVKAKVKKEVRQAEKEFDDYWGANEKGECNECGKIKVLDEENGVCKNCLENYEG